MAITDNIGGRVSDAAVATVAQERRKLAADVLMLALCGWLAPCPPIAAQERGRLTHSLCGNQMISLIQ